jgi:DHA1 family bicyclomycin/chloramphenicol resistance-like MFS transporter
LVVSGGFLIISLVSDGVPGFALFYVLTTLMVGFDVSARPTLTSQALEEVGHIAGTAASLIGATTLVIGSLLSQFIDRAIDDSVTPFIIGFVVAAIVGLVSNAWARSRQVVSAPIR